MSVNPGASQPPPREGQVEVERAIRRAEAAKEKFDRELDGLIVDLREAREAIKANPLPGEAKPDERGGP